MCICLYPQATTSLSFNMTTALDLASACISSIHISLPTLICTKCSSIVKSHLSISREKSQQGMLCSLGMLHLHTNQALSLMYINGVFNSLLQKANVPTPRGPAQCLLQMRFELGKTWLLNLKQNELLYFCNTLPPEQQFGTISIISVFHSLEAICSYHRV